MTAFLSHKYKAPVVNDYFFRLFSRAANVEFEVDIGSLATNVTRLERLIRDSDAFVGIYPFDEGEIESPNIADLTSAARYFRLELDIAARSRKPGLVFSDDRFRGIISSPLPIQQIPFNIQEVTAGGAKPSSARFVKAFAEFCRQVTASREYGLTMERGDADNRVGILLPEYSDGGYAKEHVDIILKAICTARFEPIELPWPPVLTSELIRKIRSLDWVVLDISEVSMRSGIVGYLHGEFKPAMRLRRVQASADAGGTALSSSLYSGFEVGYPKDILRWWDSESLSAGLSKRIESLEAPRKRISTLADALQYFRSAALRKEAIFVSYSGRDEHQASQLISAFRKRFQDVFDYRDGQSIRPGRPWIREIFDTLAVSPIGVPLLSPTYVASGNCLHELREMVARRDNGKMQVFPVKLSKTDRFDIPNELGDIQYARLWEYSGVEELVHWISANVPK